MIVNTTMEVAHSRKMVPTPRFMVFSFLFASFLSILIYWAPHFDWYYLWLETTTRDLVVILLNLTGVYALSNNISFPMSPGYELFGEAFIGTPGVWIPGSQYETYWIIKACTGMQAGAILISLILVTPLPQRIMASSSFNQAVFGKKQMLFKIKVIIIFLFVLFVTNSLRIWFELFLVGAFSIPFEFAEGELAKPIGFVGTLLFAWVIEKSGVPIIDTFADWLDLLYNSIKKIVLKIIRQDRSVTRV